ncbi:MAG: phosphoribosylformylglycinamidine cyclo-ligase [Bacteroidetes bacterium]|nr:phosphoribosylformylglycinamidine cyclo-ligase [Bacteroidota bacterium]
MEFTVSLTYKHAGVDIDSGEELVRRIAGKVKSTHGPRVLTGIGGFGALFDASFPEFDKPVLVSSVDGVGTKLKIAAMTGRHDTVGQDLVNHCVNDILTTGARPLFFMDYFAAGKLDPDVAEQVITGFVTACRENDCALIGGETAEMPGMYAPTEYDIAGTIVGVVERDRILDKRNVHSGDVLIGLPSSGLHTNGYSLARAALLPHFSLDAHFDDLGGTLADALLAVHRSYLHAITPLLDRHLIHALAHITGGGIVGNTMRVLPDRHTLDLDWGSWQRPRIFELIQELGGVPEDDMRRTFNLGIGMIAIVAKEHTATVLEHLASQHPVIIGNVTDA